MAACGGCSAGWAAGVECRTVHDEKPFGDWHCSDVSGRRRHPHPRLPVLHHAIENITAATASAAVSGLSWVMPTLLNAVVGVIAGAIVLAAVTGAGKMWRLFKA
jgi:hypothetical protein